MKVADILKAKGDTVQTVQSWCSVADAVGRLSGPPPIGALVVSDDGRGRLDGILTERDVVRRLRDAGTSLLELSVADVMSSHVPTCAPEDTLEHVMQEMTRFRHRHLPVVRGGVVCGLVSIGDVVRHRLSEMQMRADVMRDIYIARR